MLFPKRNGILIMESLHLKAERHINNGIIASQNRMVF